MLFWWSCLYNAWYFFLLTLNTLFFHVLNILTIICCESLFSVGVCRHLVPGRTFLSLSLRNFRLWICWKCPQRFHDGVCSPSLPIIKSLCLFMESHCCSWCPIFCSYFFYNCLYWVIQFFCLVFHPQFCFPTQSIPLERLSNEVFIGTKFFVSNIISVWVFFSNSVTIFISWIVYILFICFVFMEYIHALFELFEHAYNNSFEFFFWPSKSFHYVGAIIRGLPVIYGTGILSECFRGFCAGPSVSVASLSVDCSFFLLCVLF